MTRGRRPLHDDEGRVLPGLARALALCRGLAERPGPGGLPHDADDCVRVLETEAQRHMDRLVRYWERV